MERAPEALAAQAARSCGRTWRAKAAAKAASASRDSLDQLLTSTLGAASAQLYRCRGFGEHLLRLLMRLDGVLSGGDEAVRTRRKAAVRHIQAKMDAADALAAKAAKVNSLTERLVERARSVVERQAAAAAAATTAATTAAAASAADASGAVGNDASAEPAGAAADNTTLEDVDNDHDDDAAEDEVGSLESHESDTASMEVDEEDEEEEEEEEDQSADKTAQAPAAVPKQVPVQQRHRPQFRKHRMQHPQFTPFMRRRAAVPVWPRRYNDVFSLW